VEDIQPLLEALKAVAVAFKRADIPFALAGGQAAYVRGGHDSRKDVDFVVQEDQVPAARAALEHAGITVVEPPEDWLFKARYDDAPVDVIFRLDTGPVDAELLARTTVLPVDSVLMPVLSATDLVVAKLLALTEHYCDLEPVLASIRSLREQLDLAMVRKECAGNPFAEAALFLAERLDVLPAPGAVTEPADGEDIR
jgi:hypothetical protein